MSIQVPLLIIRSDAIQRITHIGAHIVIPVLVQGERAAGVLHEEVQHADLVVLDLGELLEDVVGDEVAAARAGRQSEGFLVPGHCVGTGLLGLGAVC